MLCYYGMYANKDIWQLWVPWLIWQKCRFPDVLQAKAAPSQAKAGALRPSRAGTSLLQLASFFSGSMRFPLYNFILFVIYYFNKYIS
jgi:hypothetical protein